MSNLSHHSDNSDFHDRELLDAVLANSDHTIKLNESCGSRLSSLLASQPCLRSTGNLSRPASTVSGICHSVDTKPIDKLSDLCNDFVELKDEHNALCKLIHNNIRVMSLLCICAIVLGLSALEMIIAMTSHPASSEDLPSTPTALTQVQEVATALSAFVLALDFTCLLVCSVQVVVVVNLLPVHDGDERALKFLHDCSSSWFVAVIGFFVSVPLFFIALILYMFLHFTSAAAITATVVLIAGTLFCIVAGIQSFYHWRQEKSRALSDLLTYECPIPKQENRAKELSTLV